MVAGHPWFLGATGVGRGAEMLCEKLGVAVWGWIRMCQVTLYTTHVTVK